jgi:hypothetical protein
MDAAAMARDNQTLGPLLVQSAKPVIATLLMLALGSGRLTVMKTG